MLTDYKETNTRYRGQGVGYQSLSRLGNQLEAALATKGTSVRQVKAQCKSLGWSMRVGRNVNRLVLYVVQSGCYSAGGSIYIQAQQVTTQETDALAVLGYAANVLRVKNCPSKAGEN